MMNWTETYVIEFIDLIDESINTVKLLKMHFMYRELLTPDLEKLLIAYMVW